MKTTKLNLNGYRNREGIQEKEIDAKRAVVKPLQLIQKLGRICGWIRHDTAENLSFTQAALRASGVISMPLILSAIDWSFHTDILIFIIPVMFYLEVTAFMMYCPIKAIFSNYKLPKQYN